MGIFPAPNMQVKCKTSCYQTREKNKNQVSLRSRVFAYSIVYLSYLTSADRRLLGDS